jgi:hypothetical protein
MMQSDLPFSLVTGVVLILLVVLTRWLWCGGKAVPAATNTPRAKRAPKPFAGFTRKPECTLCAPQARSQPQAPGAPPPRMIVTRGRRRQVATTGHVCPQAACA